MYSGMAPGFVAGDYLRDELCIDLRRLAAACRADFIEDTCERVDPVARRIHLAGGEWIGYDAASFNVGSTLLGRDLPGVREHTFPTRPLSKLIDGVEGLITRAKTHSGERPFQLLVVGAGVAGVELAFSAEARLARETGSVINVMLLNSGERILPRCPAGLVRRVERLALSRRVTIENNVRAVEVRTSGIVLESGMRVDGDAVLWVTGPTGHPLFVDSLGIETDDRGFVLIRPTLQFNGYDNLFAVGDCGTLVDYPQTPKAGVHAVRQGPFITHNLRAFLRGDSLQRYRPQREFLTLLNVGNGYAIGCKLGLSFGGRWVMRLKDRIDRGFMRKYQPGRKGTSR